MILLRWNFSRLTQKSLPLNFVLYNRDSHKHVLLHPSQESRFDYKTHTKHQQIGKSVEHLYVYTKSKFSESSPSKDEMVDPHIFNTL